MIIPFKLRNAMNTPAPHDGYNRISIDPCRIVLRLGPRPSANIRDTSSQARFISPIDLCIIAVHNPPPSGCSQRANSLKCTKWFHTSGFGWQNVSYCAIAIDDYCHSHTRHPLFPDNRTWTYRCIRFFRASTGYQLGDSQTFVHLTIPSVLPRPSYASLLTGLLSQPRS